MKKIKVLSQPTQIGMIQLDDYDYSAQDEAMERLIRLQIRRWRKLRNGMA